MLETFTLKQHLDMTRQELSQALYQHDAACRVIARLMHERDEARSMLSSLAAQGVNTATGFTQSKERGDEENCAEMEVDDQQEANGKLEAGVLSVLADTCATLSKGRKGRKAPPTQATKDEIVESCTDSSTYALSLTPHSSAKPGVTCLAMASGDSDQYVALSGGVDKMAILTDVSDGKVIAKLSGHTKKITAVALHVGTANTTAFTASADHSVKMWAPDDGTYSEVATFSGIHSAEISSLCVHPSGEYVLGVSADNSWSFVDVSRGTNLLTVRNPVDNEKFSFGGLHPDGLILACGTTSGAVRLWDVREQKNVANLGAVSDDPTDGASGGEGHSDRVTCLSFNQNGYLLASGGNEGICKIWDLRKLKNTASIDTSDGKSISCVSFDPSGVYLAIGSSAGNVDLSVTKEWTCLASLKAHKKAVTGFGWGGEAAFLLSSSLDRTMKKKMFKK